MPGNNSGRRQPGNSAVPSTVGRLGVDGFWVRDYGGGVRVGRPVGTHTGPGFLKKLAGSGSRSSVCWLFIFKDTKPSPLQDSFSVTEAARDSETTGRERGVYSQSTID